MFLQGRLDRVLESAREYVTKGEGLDRGGSIESRGTLYAKRNLKQSIDPITGFKTWITKRTFTPAEAEQLAASNAERYRRLAQLHEKLRRQTGHTTLSAADWMAHRRELISAGAFAQEVDLQKLGINSEKISQHPRVPLTSTKLERFNIPSGEGIAFYTPDKQFVYKLFIPTEEGIGGRA